MNRKLLSIITSASILASAFSFGVSAIPSAVDIMDTGLEYVPEIFEEEQVAELSSTGPRAVDILETAFETNEYYGVPDAIEGVSLMSELSGEGTEESPYLISSADDLKLMASNINSGVNTSSYYKLTTDIDLGGAEWTPIGYVTGSDSNSDYSCAFSGHFDGDGYTISNFVITKASTAYIGFFGFVYNGSIENLNLDNMSISFSYDSTDTLFAGSLVGRIALNTDNARTDIINCHVTNSAISVSGKGTLYAGGLVGLAISGADNSRVFVAFSSAECDVSASTSAAFNGTLVATGGLSGYFGALAGADISAINCYASGEIYASALKSNFASALCGGLFGNLRSYDLDTATMVYGGSIVIDSCHSEGTAVAEGDFMAYMSGGFAAQYLTTSTSFITNCYSTTDASGRHLQKDDPQYPNNDPVTGGFIGYIDLPGYSTSMGKTIIDCYASGDAIDLTYTEADASDTSFAGGFAGYSTVGIFESCYKLYSQTLLASDIFTFDCPTLTEEDVQYQDKFDGFDFADTWLWNPEAEYPYPTLAAKSGYTEFVVDGEVFDVTVFGSNGKVKAPSEKPSKDATVEKVYSFLYWSLTENGEIFNIGSDTVSSNTTFYAVFSETARPYKVSFIVEGESFVEPQMLGYGTSLSAPDGIPAKEDTESFYYEFRHWSLTENGSAFDFTEATVSGETTLYAIFEEFDKTAWKGEIAQSFSSGYGTEASPYIIRSSEEFALLAKIINEQLPEYSTTAYYALGNDINLGGYNWSPIGKSESTPFSANFDGRGYIIKNFIIPNNQYTGVFGYVSNGTIKDVHLCNFKFDLSTQNDDASYNMYAGALVGYLTATKGSVSNVSGIRVSDFECEIDVGVGRLYLGGVAGMAKAENRGTVYISDSFCEGDWTSVNENGYAYIGGIAGWCNMGSYSKFLISQCYATGSISSISYRSTYAGGVAGYIFSTDSGILEGEDASLAAEPTDIMIKDCFAVTSVSASTSAALSHCYIGYVVGDCNTYGDTENVLYPRSMGLTLNPTDDASKIGATTTNSNLMSTDYLSDNLGFDFENTWMFVTGHDYPVLKVMELNKPALRLGAELGEDDTLDITVQFVSPSNNYTIIIGVYNARNQLIKLERHNYTASYEFTELVTSFEGMKNAARVSASAVDKSSLAPLFEGVSVEI